MSYQANYPRTVAEVLDDDMTFKPECLRALRAFRRAKPWRGTVRERMVKFSVLNQALAAVYDIEPARLQFVRIGSTAGNGFYDPASHTIGLVGKLSVVTFLHEFAHALGFREHGVCLWSINLFRRIFPRSFARCRAEGHVLISDRRN